VCHDYQLMYQLIETTINIVNKYWTSIKFNKTIWQYQTGM
jgi:hypothetical protein